jgi:mercuric ion transport protein
MRPATEFVSRSRERDFSPCTCSWYRTYLICTADEIEKKRRLMDRVEKGFTDLLLGWHAASGVVRSTPRAGLAAAGGILGALAASACCIVPLVLFTLGVSGAWIGNLTQLAPYQPYFIAATVICLGFGYWLRYRSRKVACADAEVCARPLPNRVVTTGLVLATVLVISALALDFLAPLLSG